MVERFASIFEDELCEKGIIKQLLNFKENGMESGKGTPVTVIT